MSKISQEKKAAKVEGRELKGKKAKTAEAMAAKKADAEAKGPTKSALAKSVNYGKCCTCKFYGKPCSKIGKYVARKAEQKCWEAKAGGEA